jgi:hypothetical protein
MRSCPIAGCRFNQNGETCGAVPFMESQMNLFNSMGDVLQACEKENASSALYMLVMMEIKTLLEQTRGQEVAQRGGSNIPEELGGELELLSFLAVQPPAAVSDREAVYVEQFKSIFD